MPKEYRDTIVIIVVFIIIWILVFVALYGNIILVND
jgi:hypothetical protein